MTSKPSPAFSKWFQKLVRKTGPASVPTRDKAGNLLDSATYAKKIFALLKDPDMGIVPIHLHHWMKVNLYSFVGLLLTHLYRQQAKVSSNGVAWCRCTVEDVRKFPRPSPLPASTQAVYFKKLKTLGLVQVRRTGLPGQRWIGLDFGRLRDLSEEAMRIAAAEGTAQP